MAGRGRGRGRGRGAMSFDFSQLGFSAGETLPAPVLQPPPTYPPLEHKPVPLNSGPESEYMVALRRDYVEFLRYSLNFKQNKESASVIERFSDKYHNVNEKESWHSQFTWDRLPSELKPKFKGISGKRKQDNQSTLKAKKSNIDISSKLDELAKLEEKAKEEKEEETEEIKQEKDEDEENEEENLEEDEDDEMDDGTDYVNSYFDNGESYGDDEDDNLDNGPVYY